MGAVPKLNPASRVYRDALLKTEPSGAAAFEVFPKPSQLVAWPRGTRIKLSKVSGFRGIGALE